MTGILEDRVDLSATQKEAFDVVINVLDELNEEERKVLTKAVPLSISEAEPRKMGK